MRDHHDRLAELLHGAAHERQDLGAGARVEVAGGLVGEHDLRLRREGAAHRHALLLTAGQLARAVLEAVGEADGVDHRLQPRVIGLPAGERERERDVLERGQRRYEVEGLEDEAHLLAA